MSLARTALRIAAAAALDADPVVAALCPGRVFDSRIDEFDSRDPVPVIVVFTEDDIGRAWSTNNGGPPFDHACDLLLEISMRVAATVPDPTDPNASVVQIGMPETDGEMEACLDLLEEAAVTAVTVADNPQARLIRSAVTRRTTELKSIRYAAADTGAKIAMRLVTLTTHLKVDQPDPLNPPTGPFTALPDPLRTVAAAQAPTSSAYKLCLGIAEKLTAPTAAPFTGADLTLQAVAGFDPAHPPEPPGPSNPDHTASDPIAARIMIT